MTVVPRGVCARQTRTSLEEPDSPDERGVPISERRLPPLRQRGETRPLSDSLAGARVSRTRRRPRELPHPVLVDGVPTGEGKYPACGFEPWDPISTGLRRPVGVPVVTPRGVGESVRGTASEPLSGVAPRGSRGGERGRPRGTATAGHTDGHPFDGPFLLVERSGSAESPSVPRRTRPVRTGQTNTTRINYTDTSIGMNYNNTPVKQIRQKYVAPPSAPPGFGLRVYRCKLPAFQPFGDCDGRAAGIEPSRTVPDCRTNTGSQRWKAERGRERCVIADVG